MSGSFRILTDCFGEKSKTLQLSSLQGSVGRTGWLVRGNGSVMVFADHDSHQRAVALLQQCLTELRSSMAHAKIDFTSERTRVESLDIGGASFPQIVRASCELSIDGASDAVDVEEMISLR